MLAEVRLTVSYGTEFFYGDIYLSLLFLRALPIEERVYLVGDELLTDSTVNNGACHGEEHIGVCLRSARAFQVTLKFGYGGSVYLGEEDIAVIEGLEFA
jgi:hypothetical protein